MYSTIFAHLDSTEISRLEVAKGEGPTCMTIQTAGGCLHVFATPEQFKAIADEIGTYLVRSAEMKSAQALAVAALFEKEAAA